MRSYNEAMCSTEMGFVGDRGSCRCAVAARAGCAAVVNHGLEPWPTWKAEHFARMTFQELV